MNVSPLRTLARTLPLRVVASLGLAAFIVGGLGCANGEIRWTDPFDRELSLEQSQHRYTVLMRWSKYQEAKDFVPKGERDAFIERMKAFEDARFTDYESEPPELDHEMQTATVRVVYTLYLPSSPYEIEVAEIQDWSRDTMGNAWRVISHFESLPKVASK